MESFMQSFLFMTKEVGPGKILFSVGVMELTVVVAAGLGGCTTPHPEPSPALHTCGWHLTADMVSSTGMMILSPTTQALYSGGEADAKALGYVVLARGQPNWFDGKPVGGGGHISGTGPRDHIWRLGDNNLKISYDPGSNTADLLGNHILLDTANVLLVDRADRVGGETRLAAARCAPGFDIDQPARSLATAPESVQLFVRSSPDGTR